MKTKTRSTNRTARTTAAASPSPNSARVIKLAPPPTAAQRRAAIALLLDERLSTINGLLSDIEQVLIWSCEIAEGTADFQAGLEDMFRELEELGRFNEIRFKLGKTIRSAIEGHASATTTNELSPSSAVEPRKSAAALEHLARGARLLEEELNRLNIVIESVNTATGVADKEDRSEFSALADFASEKLGKAAEAATGLAVANRRNIEQALASCKSTVAAQP